MTISFVPFVEGIGVALTPAQRVIALVACDGVQPADLEGDDRALARQLFGDVDTIPDGVRNIIAIVAGARAGKSYVFGGLRALHLAFTVDLSTLAPGEVASALIVAPDLRLGKQELRYALGAANASPVIAKRIRDVSADSFSIIREKGRSVVIETLPASRGGSATRGRSLVCGVMAESAFFYDSEGYVVSDTEIYRSIAPRIMPGGQLVIASTPWSEAGLLWDLYRENFGKPTTALVAHAPTVVLRPDARTKGIVEREYARDATNAAREFGAVFMVAGSGLFFDNTSIDEASKASPVNAGPFFAGGDLAFRSDSAALAITRRDGKRLALVDLLELVPQRGAPLTPSRVVAAFAELMKKYDVETIALDGHYIESARELFRTHGITVVEAPSGQDGKASTYLQTRALLGERGLRLPENPRLVGQLKKIVSKPVPGGGLAISSPRRGNVGHGDLVSALVLSVWLASRKAAPNFFTAMRARDGGTVATRTPSKFAQAMRMQGGTSPNAPIASHAPHSDIAFDDDEPAPARDDEMQQREYSLHNRPWCR